jgi:hypothetical protein
MTIFLEFLRVLLAFVFVLVVLPLVAQGYKVWRGDPMRTSPAEWAPVLISSFIRASLAAEVGCLILGELKFCLPGLAMTVCAVLFLRGVLAAYNLGAKDASRRIWLIILAWLEDKTLRGKPRETPARMNGRSRLILALLALLLMAGVRQPLSQVHFNHAETYLRAISLSALTEGQSWVANGSVAFLAPVVFFSGVKAVSVVRFTGPILVTAFALLAAVCMGQFWRSRLVAVITIVFFVCLSLSPVKASWELLPLAIALVYLVAGAAVYRYSRVDALFAALVGVMIAPGNWRLLVLSGLVLATVLLMAWSRFRFMRLAGAGIATAGLVTLILFWVGGKPGPETVEYEAAARVSQSIANQFHRNEWLVVSPFQELAFVYGQGWHTELSSFVSDFRPQQVSKPGFAFPFDVPDVFFFVEKRPLRVGSPVGSQGLVWRYAPAEGGRYWSSFQYGDALERATLEYRAAELLDAYSQSHRDLSIFYQDDDLIVYHLTRPSSSS